LPDAFDDRYIRTGDEVWTTNLTPFTASIWKRSQRGNLYARLTAPNGTAVVVTVSQNRYRDGQWIFSYVVGGSETWETSPHRFGSEDEAANAALDFVRLLGIEVAEPTDGDVKPERAPVRETPITQERTDTIRRIRLP
jgi:hypothetical protein